MSELQREIRLYSNRRLYDTVASRYIKYEDLFQLIREQIPFTVRDVVSGSDCTQKVLVDLLVRQDLNERAQTPEILTPEFLRDFIRVSATDSAVLMREFLDYSMSLLASGSDPP